MVIIQSPQFTFSLGCRRDKYQQDLKEYWVDVETTGSFEDENEESFTEKTSGEGIADGFDLGLAPIESTAHDAGGEPDEVTDLEDEEDDSASSKAKLKVPSKNDVEQEYHLEAGI